MMPTLSKMGAAEKEQYCQNVYEKYIFETSEFLESCDKMAEVLRTYIPSGCYTNFRDILFHFGCLVDASEESVILSQVASIIEHANRAMRDAEVALCVRCVTIFKMLISKYDLSTDVEDALSQQIVFLANWVLKLRLGSMMLDGMEFLCPTNEEFLDMMEAYLECAKTHVTKEFKEIIAYAKELEKDFSLIVKNAFNSKEENELRNFKAFATYNNVAELVYDAVFGD